MNNDRVENSFIKDILLCELNIYKFNKSKYRLIMIKYIL